MSSASSLKVKAPFSIKLHIIPPLVGLLVFFLSLALLNLPWLITEGEYYLHQNYGINTISPSAIYKSSEIIIPSIGVRAPIIMDHSSNDATIALELQKGVVHYANTAVPGQNGNIVIFGHSSGMVWEPGNYKFVFTMLHVLKPNNLILINYHGHQYKYKVINLSKVPPTDMQVFNSTTQPILTLITCTPVGYSTNRLVVHALQVSPNPKLNSKLVPQNNHKISKPVLLPSNN